MEIYSFCRLLVPEGESSALNSNVFFCLFIPPLLNENFMQYIHSVVSYPPVEAIYKHFVLCFRMTRVVSSYRDPIFSLVYGKDALIPIDEHTAVSV